MKLATIDAHGSTDCGLTIIKLIDLTGAVEVTLVRKDMVYEGGVVDFIIKFDDGNEITIMNAFGMGYGGTGPGGAVTVLTRLGIPEEEAEQLYYYHEQQLTFKIPI